MAEVEKNHVYVVTVIEPLTEPVHICKQGAGSVGRLLPYI